MSASQPQSLAGLLLDRADRATGSITVIQGAEAEQVRTPADLRADALSVLGSLQVRGLSPGAEVVISVADPHAFVTAFWACILGRMIAIPVQTPTTDEHRLKLTRILDHLGQSFLITDRPDLAAETDAADIATLCDGTSPAGTVDREAEPNDIAFVQFSSGSTGAPKGVVLRHHQVLTHLSDFAASARMTADDVFLSWFPLTHDMGLIGWHLIQLALGADQYLMPTRLFVQRPSLWLAKASAHRASVLCSNNFGLKHFLKLLKPAVQAEWDLSPVRLLFNAAEPISADLCLDFQDRMAPSGLAPVALTPGYGLAEATLGVSFPSPGEPLKIHSTDRHHLGWGATVRPPPSARDERRLVDLGAAMDGVDMRVVDGAGHILDDRVVGSVEIRSRTMTTGYYRSPTADAGLFAPDGWLRTGDAGFLDGGRLVLTGRIKEIIIQAGQNYDPHDIERVAEEVDGIDLGKVVACGIVGAAEQP